MAILDHRGNPATYKEKDELTRSMAFTGYSTFGKLFSEDYNPNLQGKLAVQAAFKMLRTEAIVRATKMVIGLPVRSTEWIVEEPENASQEEKDNTERFRANLFGGMETSFDDLLREGDEGTYLGFAIPEIEWEQTSDGYIQIKRIESRNPELIERWCTDETGRVIGYVYSGNKAVGKGLDVNAYDIPEWTRVAVPFKDKTVRLVYETSYGSPTGFGLWRTMYPHWYILQALYKIMGVGLERFLLGIPVGTLQENPADPQAAEDAYLKQMKWLRAREDGALLLKFGQKFDFAATQNSGLDALPLLQYHKTQIAQVALASFITMGQASVGTQALSDTLGEFFLMAVEANADWRKGVFQRDLAEPFTRINFGDKVRPPKILHRPVAEKKDLAAIAKALKDFTSAGYLHALVDDEEFFRDKFEMPPIPENQAKARKQREEDQAINPPEPPPVNPNPNQPQPAPSGG